MDEIISMRRWLLWTEARRNDETTKQPIAPWITGNYYTPINAHDPNNWTTYDIANKYLKESNNQTIGLAIDLGDGIVGIDLDDCIDDTGRFTKEAEDIVSRTDTYVEISPSGRGLHILGFGIIPKALVHHKGSFNLEIYSDGRFFTFTGRAMKGRTELRNMQDLLDELFAEYDTQIVDVERIKKGVKKGERDDAGIKLATWYRRKGLNDSQTLEEMIKWNAKNDPPLSMNEVVGKVTSAFRRPEPYGWKYTEQPEKGKQKIKAGEIAIDLMQKHRFITADDTKTIYVYNQGIYTEAEAEIEGEVQDMLGNDATIHIVTEVLGHIQRSGYISRDRFNSTNALPVKNGVLNLNDFSFSDFNPDKIFTYKLDVEYNADADCPNIKKFIHQIVSEDDINIIQEFLGYILFPGMPAHKSLWLFGDGSNGKTTLLELVHRLIGDNNVANVSLNELDGNHRFSTARLYGKLLNIIAEPPSQKAFYTPLFKQLTGNDTIEAELKNKQKSLKFKNFAKFIILGNQFPQVRDTTYAFWRRVLVVKFPNKFEGDTDEKDLVSKLWADEKERSGFLNWCLEGLKRLKDNRFEFTTSKSMEEMKLDFQKRSDPCSAFILEMCDFKPDAITPKSDMYSSFKNYCADEGLSDPGQNALTNAIKRLPRVLEERKRVNGELKRCWVGIYVKQEGDVADDEKKGWF